MSYEQEIAEWKARHGLPKEHVNQDELLMAAEESRSKEKCWCMGCGNEMPVKEMKLVTRSIDPYLQIDESESDYIRADERVRMCPECFKERYESFD